MNRLIAFLKGLIRKKEVKKKETDKMLVYQPTVPRRLPRRKPGQQAISKGYGKHFKRKGRGEHYRKTMVKEKDD